MLSRGFLRNLHPVLVFCCFFPPLSENILDRSMNGSETVCRITWHPVCWRSRALAWHPFLKRGSEQDPERSIANLGLQHAATCPFSDYDRHSPTYAFHSHDHSIPPLCAAKDSGVPRVLTPCKDIPVDSSTPRQMVWKEYRGRKYRPLPDSHVF